MIGQIGDEPAHFRGAGRAVGRNRNFADEDFHFLEQAGRRLHARHGKSSGMGG